MAKIKEITIGASYTYQATQYHPVRGEASVTVVLGPNDDVEKVEEATRETVRNMLVANLAGIDKVHEWIHDKGKPPEDFPLATTEEEEDFDEEAWLLE